MLDWIAILFLVLPEIDPLVTVLGETGVVDHGGVDASGFGVGAARIFFIPLAYRHEEHDDEYENDESEDSAFHITSPTSRDGPFQPPLEPLPRSQH